MLSMCFLLSCLWRSIFLKSCCRTFDMVSDPPPPTAPTLQSITSPSISPFPSHTQTHRIHRSPHTTHHLHLTHSHASPSTPSDPLEGVIELFGHLWVPTLVCKRERKRCECVSTCGRKISYVRACMCLSRCVYERRRKAQ